MALNINGTTGISGVDGSASAPAVTGTDSNTGINFGSDTVNINTGGSTRVIVDSSGNLRAGTITDSSGSNSSTTAQIAKGRVKCWCNFQGGGTVAIRDSFNVDALTDNGTGDYTLEFTNDMVNNDFVLAGTAGYNSEYIAAHLTGGGSEVDYATDGFRFSTRHVYNNSPSDPNYVEVIICGSQ